MTILAKSAVLIPIDVQQGFDQPDWGRRGNPEMERNGLALLAAWRASGRTILHVKHNSVLPQSTLRPGQAGNDFKPGFEPLAGETLIEKTVNSAFIGTDLEARLRRDGVEQLVFFGISTDMCVSTTTRMAANLGFTAFLVGDACLTFDQRAPDGTPVSAETLQLAHLTTLNNEFAKVLDTSEVTARLG